MSTTTTYQDKNGDPASSADQPEDSSTARTVTFQRSQSDHLASVAAIAAAHDYITHSPLLHPTTNPLSPNTNFRHGSSMDGSMSGSVPSSYYNYRRMQSDEPLSHNLSASSSNHHNNNNNTMGSPRRRAMRYDASHAMDRLRSTFIADYQDNLNVPTLATATTLATMSSAFSSESFDSLGTLTQSCRTSNDDDDNHDHTSKRLRTRKSHRASDAIDNGSQHHSKQQNWTQFLLAGLGQVPAVALIAVFHLMIGIPFGVS